MIIVGMILLLVGFTVRLLAIRSLGSAFSLTLDVPAYIKRDGMYKYIRHPSYSGSLLMFIGLTIIDARLAVLYLAAVFYLSRIKQEEQLMKCMFHLDYTNYMKKTWALFPKIAIRRNKDGNNTTRSGS